MKKVTCILFLALFLSSCIFITGHYQIGLLNVERPENAKERYGESKIVNFEEDGETKYSYEDEMIKIIWIPLRKQFTFALENKTDHSIKIIWDEAVFVDASGSSERVMHSGVKYTDRNSPQTPTIVVRNANISDVILPTNNVYYVSGQYGGWRTRPLIPNTANTQEELVTISKKYVGKTVSILLPLKIEDTVNEYIFSFKIESFMLD